METRKDLIVLVADKNMEYTVRGVLQRHQALDIHPLDYEIYLHTHRDPGCLLEGHDFLCPFVNQFKHALIMLDHHGCGQEDSSRKDLEQGLEDSLSSSGWGDRAAAIVIDPELENWIWSESPEVEFALGWKGKSPPLRAWLDDEGYLKEKEHKPSPPKDALEKALYHVRKPRSSSIYSQVAKTVSLKRCQDPAFLKLKEKLVQWFAHP
jgi:hypothetical protein